MKSFEDLDALVEDGARAADDVAGKSEALRDRSEQEVVGSERPSTTSTSSNGAAERRPRPSPAPVAVPVQKTLEDAERVEADSVGRGATWTTRT